MAKPNWLIVDPMSGSGNGSKQISIEQLITKKLL